MGAVAAFGQSLLSKRGNDCPSSLFLVYDLATQRRPPLWRCYVLMSGLAVLAGTRLFYALHNIPEAQLAFNTKGISTISYTLTQARVVWIYVRLFLLPVGLSLDHDVRLSQGLWSPPETLPALLALALIVGALVWHAWRERRLRSGCLAFLCCCRPVPQSSLQPTCCLSTARIFPWRVWRLPSLFCSPGYFPGGQGPLSLYWSSCC